MNDAGRGVFAEAAIAPNTLIERCPVVPLLNPKERDHLRKTGLVSYYFLWGEKRDHAAICLGWGSVYNHSFTPNARYEKRMEEGVMDFYAIRDISPNEEITVNYNGAPDDLRPLRVPGIPAEAGGMQPTKLPWLINGLVRRARLIATWFGGHTPVILMVGILA